MIKKHSEFIGFPIDLMIEKTTEKEVSDDEEDKKEDNKEEDGEIKEEKEKEKKKKEDKRSVNRIRVVKQNKATLDEKGWRYHQGGICQLLQEFD